MEKELETIWSQFTQPEECYLPYPILILKEKEKKEEILRQIQDEAKIGIKKLVLSQSIELFDQVEYLSQQHFTLLREILEQARMCQLGILIQDEKMELDLELWKQIFYEYYHELKEYIGATIKGIYMNFALQQTNPSLVHKLHELCSRFHLELYYIEPCDIENTRKSRDVNDKSVLKGCQFLYEPIQMDDEKQKMVYERMKCVLDENRLVENKDIFCVCSIMEQEKQRKIKFTAREFRCYMDQLSLLGFSRFMINSNFGIGEWEKASTIDSMMSSGAWIKYWENLDRYCAGLSSLIAGARLQTHVALLYDGTNIPYKLASELHQNQISFCYVRIQQVDQAEILQGKIQIEGYTFDTFFCSKKDILTRIYLEDKIKGIKLQDSVEGIEQVDFEVEEELAQLRVEKYVKDNMKFYMVLNQSENAITTRFKTKEEGMSLFFDVWKRTITVMNQVLYLEAYGSGLIFYSKEPMPLQGQKENSYLRKVYPSWQTPYSNNWTGYFQLLSEKYNQKTYYCNFKVDQVVGTEEICLLADEIVECYCNGAYIGTSYWNIHRFLIGQNLRLGDNEVIVLVTGNVRNEYFGRRIPYGLLPLKIAVDGRSRE